MSTIKSSAENLTLNADGANNDIKFQSNGSEVASIDQAGTITATTFTGAATDATKLPLAGGTMTGNTLHGDNVEAKFGAGNDLRILHDGSNSYIVENGTGNLIIKATELKLKSSAGEDFMNCTADGSVELQHNNAKKIETTATGVNVTGAITVNGAALSSGITEADQWRMTTSFNSPNDGVSYITQNWERPDTYGGGYLGTGMSESAGVWTFPSTGIWLVTFNVRASSPADARYISARINTTLDNSSYSIAAIGYGSINPESSYWYTNIRTTFMFDVTNVSTRKVKFSAGGIVNDVGITGDTSQNETYVTFLKLGDT